MFAGSTRRKKLKWWFSLLAIAFLACPAQATTVIYDGKYLAADTQVTVTYPHSRTLDRYFETKIHKVKGYWIAGAGNLEDIKRFVRWMQGLEDYPLDGSFNCLVISKKTTLLYTDYDMNPKRVAVPVVLGSGGKYALHAYLTKHCNVEEAVSAAFKEDMWSGGPIEVVKVN